MRALPEILRDINASTAELGNVERKAILQDIFGAEAGSGMAELVNAMGEGQLDEIVQALGENYGENARMARTMADNIGGITRLLLDWSPLGVLWRGISTALELLGVEIPKGFTSLGTFIVDGLIGGIDAKWQALKDTIGNMASGVTGWFKERLGINSPTKVFEDFGGNLVEGLVNGIDEKWNALKDAIGGTATLPAAADVPIDTRPPLQAHGGGGITIQGGIKIEVNASPGMGEQALARYVAAEVQRALAGAERDTAALRRSAFHDID